MFTTTSVAARRTVLAAALIAGLGLGALHAPASFAEQSAPQHAVSYADLDIASPEGAAALYRRLQSAARSVCNPLLGRNAAAIQRYNQCREKAVREAVSAVNERTLTALHGRSASKTAQADVANVTG